MNIAFTTHLAGLNQMERRFPARRVESVCYPAGSENGARQQAATLRFEMLLFAILLAIVNAPFLGGAWSGRFAFLSERVAQGEWWRMVTHPFVHVSWYHLLLDGTAFFMLYAELREWAAWRRLAAIIVSALGSLLAALTSPVVYANGFGGLSGAAHGLMAISAVEMIRGGAPWERRAGWCALVAVITKAAFEAATGNVALAFLHFGLMGVPVAACHAGGVIGGLGVSLWFGAKRPRVPAGPLQP